MASENVQAIVDAIKELKVMELSELVSELEEEFDVTASAPMAVAAAPAAGGADAGAEAGGAEEKSEYDVVLEKVGGEKIKVIKEVRDITGLGLKDAKALVDEAPKTIKEGVPTEEAEAMKAKLEEVGATVELK